jgi:hypothetical protein
LQDAAFPAERGFFHVLSGMIFKMLEHVTAARKKRLFFDGKSSIHNFLTNKFCENP